MYALSSLSNHESKAKKNRKKNSTIMYLRNDDYGKTIFLWMNSALYTLVYCKTLFFLLLLLHIIVIKDSDPHYYTHEYTTEWASLLCMPFNKIMNDEQVFLQKKDWYEEKSEDSFFYFASFYMWSYSFISGYISLM